MYSILTNFVKNKKLNKFPYQDFIADTVQGHCPACISISRPFEDWLNQFNQCAATKAENRIVFLSSWEVGHMTETSTLENLIYRHNLEVHWKITKILKNKLENCNYSFSVPFPGGGDTLTHDFNISKMLATVTRTPLSSVICCLLSSPGSFASSL